MSLILTRAEVSELTGKRRTDAQQRVLKGLGIFFRVRPDGSVVVLRSDVERGATVQAREPKLRL
jgi:hypothetical protein